MRLAAGGEADDVGEQHRDLAGLVALAVARPRLLADDRLDDGRRVVALEALADAAAPRGSSR